MKSPRRFSLSLILPIMLAGIAAIIIAVLPASTNHAGRPSVPPPVKPRVAQTQDLTYTVNLPLVVAPFSPTMPCADIATNGDFEAPLRGHPWTGVANTTGAVYVDTFVSSARAHSGAQSGRVGSSSRNSVWNEMIQTAQMPANVVSATLTYWRFLDTTETSLSVVYDRFTAGIETEQGIQTLAPQQIDNTSSGRGAWVKGSIDLPNASAYSNQRLWLSFKAATDSNLPSSLYIDDVSFIVCAMQ